MCEGSEDGKVWLTIIPKYMTLCPLWTFDAWVRNLVNCDGVKSEKGYERRDEVCYSLC